MSVLRRTSYCAVVLGGGIVFSAWGAFLETTDPMFRLNAETWFVWGLAAQVFLAALTYPAGLASLSVWWLWQAGIATAAESVFLQFPLATALGFLQWFIVLPKLFAVGPNRSLEPTAVGEPLSAVQLQRYTAQANPLALPGNERV
jgi:hypothetical protein